MKYHVPLPGNHRIPGQPDWISQVTAPDFQRIARAIDGIDAYEAISTSEHIVMPKFEVPRLGPYWMHALTVMSFVAGATSRLRVDATVLVLPYHHPVEMAKVVSTLDVLSGGRVNVSIGVGHAVAEFDVLGIPFKERGARTDEALEVMKLCWTDPEPEFSGRFFHVGDVAFQPAPVQTPPPIYVGGNSEAALRRAARHQGWQPNPVDFTLAEVGPKLDYIRRQPEYAGKEDTFVVQLGLGMGPLEGNVPVFGSSTAAQREELRDYLVGRIDRLTANDITTTSLPAIPTASVDDFIDCATWFAEEVVPNCAG